jgi:hypothetical protein
LGVLFADILVYWTPEERGPQARALNEPNHLPDSAKADLFVAVQQQLGLQISSKRKPVEVLVIDRIERLRLRTERLPYNRDFVKRPRLRRTPARHSPMPIIKELVGSGVP